LWSFGTLRKPKIDGVPGSWGAFTLTAPVFSSGTFLAGAPQCGTILKRITTKLHASHCIMQAFSALMSYISNG